MLLYLILFIRRICKPLVDICIILSLLITLKKTQNVRLNILFVQVQHNDMCLLLFPGLGLTASYWTFGVNAQYIYIHMWLNKHKEVILLNSVKE